MPKPLILVAEDQDLAQVGLITLLSSWDYPLSMPPVDRGPDLLPRLLAEQPDILLLDVNMPAFSLITALEDIARHHLRTRILLVTALIAPDALRAARDRGIAGCVLKSESLVRLLPDAIAQIAAGRTAYSPEARRLLEDDGSDGAHLPPLSDLQRQAARELLHGVKPGDIGRALGVSRTKGYEVLNEMLFILDLDTADYQRLLLHLVDHRTELDA